MAVDVYMSHSDIDAVAGPVSREAFDNHYSDKGWEEVDQSAAFVFQATGQSDLSELTKAELVKYAESSGISVDSTAKKSDILSAIEAATAGS